MCALGLDRYLARRELLFQPFHSAVPSTTPSCSARLSLCHTSYVLCYQCIRSVARWQGYRSFLPSKPTSLHRCVSFLPVLHHCLSTRLPDETHPQTLRVSFPNSLLSLPCPPTPHSQNITTLYVQAVAMEASKSGRSHNDMTSAVAAANDRTFNCTSLHARTLTATTCHTENPRVLLDMYLSLPSLLYHLHARTHVPCR